MNGLSKWGPWLAGLALVAPLQSATPPAAPTVDIRRDATVDAVAAVLPSVVNIATEEEISDEQRGLRPGYGAFGNRRPSFSLGSGVIIDKEGYILTNFHVVKGAARIMVRLADGRERVARGKVVQAWSDLALLKIEALPEDRNKPFTPIKLAREGDLLLGETVLALGNPFGLGGSVSRGILSSKNRRPFRQNESLEFADWLQTDAAINPGNSGGPLVNLRGELIGINVAIYREGQGIGFAIPVKHIYEALTSFFTPEAFSNLWFGGRIEFASLRVDQVEEGSPAAKSGLRTNDIVTKVNGKSPGNLIDLNREFVETGTKAAVPIQVRRENQLVNLSIRLASVTTLYNEDLIRKKTGLSVRALRRDELSVLRDFGLASGLLIRGVESGSPAEPLELEPDVFILTHVDRIPANRVVDVAHLLHQLKSGTPVSLRLVFFADTPVGQRMGSVERTLRVR